MNTKICTKCEVKKFLKEFKKDKTRSNGKSSWCKVCHARAVAEYNKKNRDKANERNRKYRINNKEKVKLRRKYDKALRRARKKLATPSWIDLKSIKEFYNYCPEGYHVDHIIPLQHNLVCGLHTIDNLQYLSAKDNIKKNNYFDNTLNNNSWREL